METAECPQKKGYICRWSLSKGTNRPHVWITQYYAAYSTSSKTEARLDWYETESAFHLTPLIRQSIYLEDVTDITKVQPTIANINLYGRDTALVFEVRRHCAAKPMTFKADSEMELQNWLSVLKACIVSAQNKEVTARTVSDHIREEDSYTPTTGAVSFWIEIEKTEAAVRCGLAGMYRLTLSEEQVTLCRKDITQPTCIWQYRHIRRTGTSNTGMTFMLEAGRKCATGEGVFIFKSFEAQTIYRTIQTKLSEYLAAKRDGISSTHNITTGIKPVSNPSPTLPDHHNASCAILTTTTADPPATAVGTPYVHLYPRLPSDLLGEDVPKSVFSNLPISASDQHALCKPAKKPNTERHNKEHTDMKYCKPEGNTAPQTTPLQTLSDVAVPPEVQDAQTATQCDTVSGHSTATFIGIPVGICTHRTTDHQSTESLRVTTVTQVPDATGSIVNNTKTECGVDEFNGNEADFPIYEQLWTSYEGLGPHNGITNTTNAMTNTKDVPALVSSAKCNVVHQQVGHNARCNKATNAECVQVKHTAHDDFAAYYSRKFNSDIPFDPEAFAAGFGSSTVSNTAVKSTPSQHVKMSEVIRALNQSLTTNVALSGNDSDGDVYDHIDIGQRHDNLHEHDSHHVKMSEVIRALNQSLTTNVALSGNDCDGDVYDHIDIGLRHDNLDEHDSHHVKMSEVIRALSQNLTTNVALSGNDCDGDVYDHIDIGLRHDNLAEHE